MVTPGTITDGALLNEGKNNFLCAACLSDGVIGLAFADISTAEIFTTSIDGEDKLTTFFNEVYSYQPSEIILCDNTSGKEDVAKTLTERYSTLVNTTSKNIFNYERARERVRRVYPDDLDRLTSPEMLMSVGALLLYIEQTQKTETMFTRGLNIYYGGQYLEIDMSTKRNLELVESMRTKEKRGSLLWVLDKTKTAMGARLLRSYVLKPLLNPATITNRQAAVSDLVSSQRVSAELSELLSSIRDIERLTAKAVYGTANAKDLRAICQSIEALPKIKSLLSEFKSSTLKSLYNELDTLDDLYDLLSKALVDDPPFSVREGGMIREGFNADVDYYRNLRNNGSDIMASIEQREKEDTGIKTLKVSFNKVFGYYIEVSKSFVNDVPDRYVRKQTLTNCERYITSELKELENTIFSAEDKLVTLEFELFSGLRMVISENNERIRQVASIIASLDVYRSLAEVASKNGYVCPVIDLSSEIVIKDGRHPVVEKFVTDSYFVPNDTLLDTASNRMMIITGPNMAGKSTYMRQVAIITIMAQIGSFVPAREARIGIVDKVFTRVGASDDLASGQSTFMLEMTEVANILKNATKRSLIIYDEVGRGTSTYDGMSIARAVVEYTHSKKIGAKTLFATHYHELTDMEDSFDGVVNYNIAAKKRSDSIIFLRKIVKGSTDDSYGIEVAKLAGVPNEVVKRAKEILKSIEEGSNIPRHKSESAPREEVFDLFSGLAASSEKEACDKIRAIDINTITPIEAMNLLFELKKIITD